MVASLAYLARMAALPSQAALERSLEAEPHLQTVLQLPYETCLGVGRFDPSRHCPGRPDARPACHGGVRFDTHLEVSVADDSFFKPVSIAPDFYYGFSKALVFGLTHSAASQGVVDIGRSVRLNGGDSYNGLNFEIYIPLINAVAVTMAPNVAFTLDRMDPLDYSFKAGGLLSITAARISLVGLPHMVFPINHRNAARDNVLRIPIWFYYHWKEFFSFYLLSGLNDGSLQLAAGSVVSATESVRLGAQFGWPRFAGDNNTLDVMVLSLFAQFIF
jgi:hypothetical protein